MGTTRLVTFGKEASQLLKEGVDIICNTVKATLGAAGRTVLIEDDLGRIQITKDGVTAARHVVLEGRIQNMAANLIREVASRTAEQAGDGTSSSCVYAQKLYTGGLDAIESGLSLIDIKRGIDNAAIQAVDYIKSVARPIESHLQVQHVARVSANHDIEIGDLIAGAFEKVGKDGVVRADVAQGFKSEMELVNGVEVNQGYVSPYFVNNKAKMTCQLDRCMVLLFESSVNVLDGLLPIIEYTKENDMSLLIFARDIGGEALNTIVTNVVRGTIKVCAVDAPDFGAFQTEIFEDIASVTNATVLSPKKGHKQSDLSKGYLQFAGYCEKAIVGKGKTVLMGCKGDPTLRIEGIEQEIEAEKSRPGQERLKQRIARLRGKIALVKVAANSETELGERLDRVDDAINATRAALEEGIVAGGGVISYDASKALKDTDNETQNVGIELMRQALREPFSVIVSNGGEDPDALKEKIGGNIGYDVRTREFVDMFERGIVDPAKVTRCAIQNAASVVGTLLTTEAVISVNPKSIQNAS